MIRAPARSSSRSPSCPGASPSARCARCRPAAVLEEFYAAYRLFAELLERPELRLDFRLAPGDCLVFDNTRLLHARTAFAESGGRHLQGAYADIDGLLSALAVLRREGARA